MAALTLSRYPLLEAALLAHRWDGFLSAHAIAARLDQWSLKAVREELMRQAEQGRLWRIVEIATPPGFATAKFALPRNDAADMVIPGRPPSGAMRRTWQFTRTPSQEVT